MIRMSKSSVECYTLRSQKPLWWAIITISEKGLLNIISDYGTYGYLWNAFGDSFKKFLIDIDDTYLMNKLSDNRYSLYIEKTIKAIKEQIIQLRKTCEINAYVARECYNEIKKLESCSNDIEFYTGLQECPLLIEAFQGDLSSIPYITGPEYSLIGFLKTIWPEFIKILKKEVNGK